MAYKRKHRKRRKSNPVRKHKAGRVYHVFSNKKRKHRRYRRNPEGSITRMTVGNITAAGVGAIGGAVAYEVTNKLLQTEGNGKYLVAVGIAGLGWWLLDKFYPKAAVPFAAGVVAIAAKDYLAESQILDGLLGSLGYVPPGSYYDGNLGLVPGSYNPMLGLVPGSDVALNNPAMYAGIHGTGTEN